jgi:hypothetical protein
LAKENGKTKKENSVIKNIIEADKVVRRVTGNEVKGRAAELPLVSAVFDTQSEMENAIEALREGHRLKDGIENLTKGYDDTETGQHINGLENVKELVTAISVGVDVPGYRFGDLAVFVSTQSQRRFNKDVARQLLIDNGVDPTLVGQVFEAANVEGDPFYKVEFKKI